MPGMAAWRAAAEATSTESPTAVTCQPETAAGCVRVWHAEIGAAFGGGLVWEAALICWPWVTWRSRPAGATDAGGCAMPMMAMMAAMAAVPATVRGMARLRVPSDRRRASSISRTQRRAAAAQAVARV